MESEVIHSRQNPRIKHLVKLREKTVRRDTGLFVVEGQREVERLLLAGFEVVEAYVCPAFFRQDSGAHALCGQLEEVATEAFEVAHTAFEKASMREGPDGFIAVARQKTMSPDELKLPEQPLLLLLEGLEKPGNLGAIFRSAESVGVDAVLCADLVTDIYNPNVIRASQGAIFSLQFASGTGEEMLKLLQTANIPLVATTPDAAQSLWDVPLAQAVAVAMGSEKDGLTPELLAAATYRCSIPQQGTSDSLNVSVATALLLYEALRQRRLA